jgi:hypothetical protein
LKAHPHIELIEGRGLLFKKPFFFVGEHNYEQPHTNDGILDIEGRHPTKKIVSKCLS